MKPINVELLMGHSVGVSNSYYKPKETELLEDYKKAIPLLSIEQAIATTDVSKEIEELRKEVDENKLGMELLRPLMKQLAKESKTKKFTFTAPDGTVIGSVSLNDLEKQEG